MQLPSLTNAEICQTFCTQEKKFFKLFALSEMTMDDNERGKSGDDMNEVRWKPAVSFNVAP